MEYKDVVKDFASRTRRNLEFIREEVKCHEPDEQKEVYEVTQLINSMLGLLVFPQQEYVDSIPTTPLDALLGDGWPKIHATPDLPDKVDTLKLLVQYLRNAIAHFQIMFIADDYHQITGVRVWNERRGVKTWEACLSLEDLEKITDRFLEMLLAAQHTGGWSHG